MNNLLATGDHVQAYGLQGDVHRAWDTGWQIITSCRKRVTQYGSTPEYPWAKTNLPIRGCPECMNIEEEEEIIWTKIPAYNYVRCPFDGSAYVVITTVGYHGLDDPYPIYNFYCTVCGDEFDDQSGDRLIRLDIFPIWQEDSRDKSIYYMRCPFDESMMSGEQVAIGGSMDNPPEPVYIAYCDVCCFDFEL